MCNMIKTYKRTNVQTYKRTNVQTYKVDNLSVFYMSCLLLSLAHKLSILHYLYPVRLYGCSIAESTVVLVLLHSEESRDLRFFNFSF